jgi:hypothetical protein
MGDNRLPVVRYGWAMRRKHILAWPGHDPVHSNTGEVAIVKRHPEFPGNRRLRRDHQVHPGRECSPPLEPTGFEILDQIRENGGPAQAMEENDFGCDPVSPHDNLVDIIRPFS